MQLIPFLLTLLLAAAAVAGEPPAAPMLRIETGRHTAMIKRIATDSQGRWAATASDDKTLRLWDAQDGSLLQTFRLPSGAGDEGKLYAAAMDPAGGWLIAVGFNDSTAVTVLDTKQLTQLYAADTSGLDNGSLNNVAWSADGILFAGGRTYYDGSFPVFRWANKGQGKRESWQAADNAVMDLKPLPDNGLLVGAGDPALLRYDSQGRKQFDLRPNLPDMRNKLGDSFQLSADGRQIAFGLALGGEEPVCFDLHQRQLRKGQCKGSLTAPRTAASGLKIEGWKDTTNPTLNGKPLALEQYDMARSVAVAPDSQHILLGTDWKLRLFDREGKEVWQQPVPGAAWGVNISGDGRLAVAAFGDGTVRWFRLSDGEPLLSLFVTKDGGQWVAWTPGGWYDSSPGGDSLIGWQVNNGKDQLADFFPASQFRERFYRPDVTAKVLETLDESKAVAQADAALGGRRSAPAQLALPPAVELLAPADGSSFSSPTLSLRYRVRIHRPLA